MQGCPSFSFWRSISARPEVLQSSHCDWRLAHNKSHSQLQQAQLRQEFRNPGFEGRAMLTPPHGDAACYPPAVTWPWEWKHPRCNSSAKSPSLWANPCYFSWSAQLNRPGPPLLTWHQTWKGKALQLSLRFSFPFHHWLLSPDSPCLFILPSNQARLLQSVIGLHLKAIHEASETCAKIQCTLLIGNKRIVFHFTTQLNPKASSCLESHPLCSSPFCWWQFTDLKKSTHGNKANSGGTLTI